jgi:toxin ParE1/3/4
MTRPADFTPAAQHDLRAAIDWVAKDNPAAARALSTAVEAAARRIGARPKIDAARPHLTSGRHRFLLLRSFPYLLVYAADTTPPRILRILHTSRDLPPLLADLGP